MARKIKAAATVAPVINYAGLGAELAHSFVDGKASLAKLDAEYASRVAALKSAQLQALAMLADQHKGMTAETFDAEVRPSVIAALQDRLDEKDAKSVRVTGPASIIKACFLALADGVLPSEAAGGNIQKFVTEARAHLNGKGESINKKGAGAPKGTHADVARVVDKRMSAAKTLADTGADLAKGKIALRARMLHALSTPGNWKLLEKILLEGVKQTRDAALITEVAALVAKADKA